MHSSHYYSIIMVLLASLSFAHSAQAVSTHLKIHVKSKDAKFIGSEVGGAKVQIFEAVTGKLLAQGVTQGGTGDTRTIMERPRSSREPITDEQTAKFEATLDLERPTWVRIVARGPLAYPQSQNSASVTQWIFPGKHIDQGDGIILEIPGLIVDLQMPRLIFGVNEEANKMILSMKVAMLCGCPVRPQGLWDANNMEMKAEVVYRGRHGTTEPERKVVTFQYDQSGDLFTSRPIEAPSGQYEILVSVFDKETGNTGMAQVTYSYSH